MATSFLKVAVMTITHTSASPTHYDKESATYDAFNADNATVINLTLDRILTQYSVKTVLDLTCGTGLQVFWLLQQGFCVEGYDINEKMLKIAKQKAVEQGINVRLGLGDMRTTNAGTFDAVITIFNAIGHLIKLDFEQALRNIYTNLKLGGLYIFDIFNLDSLLHEDNITSLTIDWLKRYKNTVVREIQYSTVDEDGVLASYDIYHEKVIGSAPRIETAFQTLQVYGAEQLQNMLYTHGFKVVSQTAVDGGKFNKTETERILTVAQKI